MVLINRSEEAAAAAEEHARKAVALAEQTDSDDIRAHRGETVALALYGRLLARRGDPRAVGHVERAWTMAERSQELRRNAPGGLALAEGAGRGRRSAAAVYAYHSGVPTEGYHWSFAPGSMSGLIPTNDGLTVVFAMVSSHRFLHRLRRNLDRATPEVLAGHAPAVQERVAASQRVTRPRAFPGTPGWLRRAYGPGWALVGDAGFFKDPTTAHGLSDALRDAGYLADAVDAGLRGRQPMAQALDRYGRTRDEVALDLRESDAIAGFDWTLDEVQGLHRSMSKVMQREVAAMADVPEEARTPVAA